MADATVAEVCADAAAELADFAQEVYSTATCLPFFRSAYAELWDCMGNNGLQRVEATATYTLPANTSSLTPAVAGITNMGEPIRVWERGSASEKYSELRLVDELPQSDPDGQLGAWSWEGDTFLFVGATGQRLLKIEYYASASPPTSGSIGIDGARNFLAVRTASLLAASLGMQDRKVELAVRALGPGMQPDGSGGLLRQFINPMVKRMIPVRLPRWRNRRAHY